MKTFKDYLQQIQEAEVEDTRNEDNAVRVRNFIGVLKDLGKGATVESLVKRLEEDGYDAITLQKFQQELKVQGFLEANRENKSLVTQAVGKMRKLKYSEEAEHKYSIEDLAKYILEYMDHYEENEALFESGNDKERAIYDLVLSAGNEGAASKLKPFIIKSKKWKNIKIESGTKGMFGGEVMITLK